MGINVRAMVRYSVGVLKEYEVKVPVNDLDTIEMRLKSLGAELVGYREEQDYYIDVTSCVGITPLDSALRVRTSKDITSDSVRSELTFKGPRERHEFAKIRTEISVVVDDAEKLLGIFRALGFKIIAVILKKRKTYRYGGYNIHLDEVKGLGKFIEVEYVTGRECDPGLLDEAMRIIEKLDAPKNFIQKSYLELILAKANGKS